jgi:hypothetical protein
MTPNFEQVLSQALALPAAERQRLIEILSSEPITDEWELRKEAVKQAKGSMAGLLPSTEEFLAEKHAEIEEELRREGQ